MPLSASTGVHWSSWMQPSSTDLTGAMLQILMQMMMWRTSRRAMPRGSGCRQ